MRRPTGSSTRSPGSAGMTPADRKADRGPAEQGPQGASESVEELLGRLEGRTAARPRPLGGSLARAVADTDDHAGALRATLKAREDAEQMLVVAAAIRREASEQAAEILAEANGAANRLTDEAQRHLDDVHREFTTWATDQREAVKAVVADLVNSANRDAEVIRLEATSSSIAAAEDSAQQMLARSAIRAARDAEAIRAEAREVLAHSRTLLEDTNESARAVATSIAEFLNGTRERSEAIEELVVEAAVRLGTTAGSVDAEIVPISTGPITAQVSTDSDVVAAAVALSPIAATNQMQHTNAEKSASANPRSATRGAPAQPSALPHGRPLGALFRDRGSR